MSLHLVGDSYSKLIPQWHKMTSCLVGDNYSQLLPQWHQMTLCPAGWQMQPPGTQLTKNDMVDRLPSGTVQHRMTLYWAGWQNDTVPKYKVYPAVSAWENINVPHQLTHTATSHHTDTQGHLTTSYWHTGTPYDIILTHKDPLHLYTSTPQIPSQHRNLYWTEFWRLQLHKDMVGSWKIDLVYGCVKCHITNN